MRRMWTRLGGVVWHLPSITWTRMFAPLSTLAAMAEARRGGRSLPGRGPLRAVDRVAALPVRRWVGAPDPTTTSEPLTPTAVVEHLDGVAAGHGLRPAYDEQYLQWLLDEVGMVESRGPLHSRLVRNAQGKVLGWYVVYVPMGGIAQVLQVGATAADAGAVLDDLSARCAGAGAAAVQGRLEPRLYDAVTERRFGLRAGSLVLVHARDTATERAILAGESYLSRLDGEWWMAPHLDAFDRPVHEPSPAR
jgi:hypothetical protein